MSYDGYFISLHLEHKALVDECKRKLGQTWLNPHDTIPLEQPRAAVGTSRRLQLTVYILQYPKHLQVIIDKLYQCVIMGSLSRHDPQPARHSSGCPQTHVRLLHPGFRTGARPSRGPSNSSGIVVPRPVSLSRSTNKTIFHSPYTLPSSVSRKSCICHSYENCRSAVVFFPFWKVCRSPRRELAFHSSSFFSRSCALFSTLQNSTLFFSSDCALFVQKHPGWGYLSPFKSSTSGILEGQK